MSIFKVIFFNILKFDVDKCSSSMVMIPLEMRNEICFMDQKTS